MRRLVIVLIVVSWFVTVRFAPVLGPFEDLAGCNRAAAAYGLANHVLAVCQWF
jgi:hypothetical protein